MISLPKPEKRGPKPRRPIGRGKRPARVRQRGNRGALRELADDVMSLYVRHLANWKCWVCDSTRWEEMQAAHLFAKSEYHGGRYFIENVQCLCFRCHKKYTHRPAAWAAYLQGRLGMERYEQLRAYCALMPGKHDYVAQIIYYAMLTDRLDYNEAIRERTAKLQARGEKLGVW